jgi:hypothetical protein
MNPVTDFISGEKGITGKTLATHCSIEHRTIK